MPINRVFLAIADGNLSQLKELIDGEKDKTALLKEKFGGTQETYLHTAVRYVKKSPDLKILQYILAEVEKLPLLQKEEILSSRNAGEQTALHLAASLGFMDAIRLLLEAGADHKATTQDLVKATARDTLKIFCPDNLKQYDAFVLIYGKHEDEKSSQPNTKMAKQRVMSVEVKREKNGETSAAETKRPHSQEGTKRTAAEKIENTGFSLFSSSSATQSSSVGSEKENASLEELESLLSKDSYSSSTCSKNHLKHQ